MRRRTALWAAAVVAMVVIAIVGFPFAKTVGMQVIDSMRGPVGGPVPVVTADLSGAGPGSLLSAMTMPGFSRRESEYRMRSARVVYRSTSGDGQPTEVSGSVFVPSGGPPPGGWPVIAVGHGTTGIDEPCAPSLSDDLLGYAETVGTLTTRGFAVALPDYQGLGAPGVHPYTDSRTAGLNVIDAVRALRATFPNISNRWGAFGGSQGGGAVWAADEQAHDYAPELTLVGAVSVSPVADITGLVNKAQQSAVTKDQELGIMGVVESLARLHPDVNRDDYRRGAAAKGWDEIVACSGRDMAHRDDAAKAVRPNEVAPSTTEAADLLRRYLAAWALPQKRLSAPLYVWYGGADTFFDPPWTAEAIERACALGGVVVAQFEKDKGHVQVDYVDQFNWLSDRFAGRPVTNGCA
jgi:alpha-beta hydrolase superfamily lysophospholipase